MYFGTDGIRGVANKQITATLAHSCGNALSAIKHKCLVVVGRDTRMSGEMILHSLAGGVMQGGGDVIDVGIMPTAGIAYLTRVYNADYGVVISASHNPAEYNGIKVFDKDGFKLDDDHEMEIEEAMASPISVEPREVGKYTFMHNASDTYLAFLVKDSGKLDGLRILIDCSNGASWEVAPRAFKMLGASIEVVNNENSGENINHNAGSLNAGLLAPRVKDGKFDVAFAYDGDSDRLIALNEKGEIVDGDMILYVMASEKNASFELKPKTVVGTSNSNMGIEIKLKQKGIEMIRADVGDKYVLREMLAKKAKIGAEQSGHIIMLDNSTTGDGILASIVLANIIRKSNKKLSALCDVELFPQVNLDIEVRDKIRLINNELLSEKVEVARAKLAGEGRITVRASGTEPKLRVMVECKDKKIASEIAEELIEVIKNI